MVGIKEVCIWVNFSENEKGEIIGEFRSKDVLIVDIVKKFGGGGYVNVCGVIFYSWE